MQLSFILIRCVNHHLNHKSKFTKVTRNALHAHFDRPYWSRTLSSILCIFLIIYSVLTNRMSSTFLRTFFGLHNEISISKSIHYYQFSVNFSKRISIPSAVYTLLTYFQQFLYHNEKPLASQLLNIRKNTKNLKNTVNLLLNFLQTEN